MPFTFPHHLSYFSPILLLPPPPARTPRRSYFDAHFPDLEEIVEVWEEPWTGHRTPAPTAGSAGGVHSAGRGTETEDRLAELAELEALDGAHRLLEGEARYIIFSVLGGEINYTSNEIHTEI